MTRIFAAKKNIRLKPKSAVLQPSPEAPIVSNLSNTQDTRALAKNRSTLSDPALSEGAKVRVSPSR
jgi:hypothetical protein